MTAFRILTSCALSRWGEASKLSTKFISHRSHIVEGTIDAGVVVDVVVAVQTEVEKDVVDVVVVVVVVVVVALMLVSKRPEGREMFRNNNV